MTLQIALIPPTSLLDFTYRTSYQLALPHMLDSDNVYSEHYSHLADSFDHHIILDNGEAEGQNKYSPHQLWKLATTYGFDEVVAHDIMGDSHGTVLWTGKFIEALRPELEANPGALKIGAVAQSTSIEGALWTAEHLLTKFPHEIDVLYIPRLLIATTQRTTARVELALLLEEKLNLQERHIGIHLLGAHHDAPMEVLRVTQDAPNVRSMDTSMPFNYAYAGAHFGEGHHKRPEGYFELAAHDFNPPLAAQNVEVLLRWAKTGKE
jgi:hypothetical protein